MFKALFDYLNGVLTSASYQPWVVAIEVVLIAAVIYTVLRFLHGTRGAHLMQGVIILLVVSFVLVRVLADQFGLERIVVLFQPFVWTVMLTTVIVFQPELRRGLMRLGETRWRRARQSDIDRIARPIATACSQLSKNKIGALIAIERDIGLSGLTDQGVALDARISAELLNTIFWPGSALHDLGVIIQRGRIAAAGCQFPLGDVDGLDRSIGSRHRAAIGLSLDSDAVVVVVSEETGAISIAVRDRLYRHIPPDALFNTLRRHLTSPRGMKPREGDAGRGPGGPPPPRDRRADGEGEQPDEDDARGPSVSPEPGANKHEPAEAPL